MLQRVRYSILNDDIEWHHQATCGSSCRGIIIIASEIHWFHVEGMLDIP